MGWLFVPASVVSSSGFTLPYDVDELSVTSRGRRMPPRYWLRAWEMAPWMKLLSGMTLPPSMARRGVESWISSLRESRVSRSAQPASDSASTTSGGSGPTSLESFATWDRDSSSWRTCQGSLFTDSVTFSGPWPRSGSMRSGMCFPRPESELHTSGAGSSYSRGEYPAPVVSRRDNKGGRAGPSGPARSSLETWAKTWPTPQAYSFGDSHQPGTTPLDRAARPELAKCKADRGWPTPTSAAARQSGKGQRGEETLNSLAKTWATPTTEPNRHVGGFHGDASLQAQAVTGPHGSKINRVLNPRFVEMLMGWPAGWTDCEQPATESYRSWLRAHSSHLRDVLA